VSVVAERMRIGEVAARTGLTTRTIRYYEEIGLLPGGDAREKGRHRSYDEADVERLLHVTRLRDLLGLSLEELSELVEAEEARAALRRRWEETESREERLRIVEQALVNVDRQLELVRHRTQELGRLEQELAERRKLILRRRRELAGP